MMAESRNQSITITEIQCAVCRHFEIARGDLIGPSKCASVAMPRHIAMLLAHEITGRPLEVIARVFGRANHTTVLAALQRARHLIRTRSDIAAAVQSLREEITAERRIAA